MGAYLRKASEGGLRALLEPGDIEAEVAPMIPARQRDWFGIRETQQVADFVGGKLHDATIDSLNRLVPRVIAASLKNPSRAVRDSDVPHHGYLDILVLNALLADSSPLDVVLNPAQVAAYNKAATQVEKAENQRIKHLEPFELQRMLDQTLSWINEASRISAPWVVPIDSEMVKAVSRYQDHFLELREERRRGLAPVIDAQHRIVRDAYFGMEAIVNSSAKPSSGEEARRTPEYRAMYEYAMAISDSRSADVAERHLANAKAEHQKLEVTTAEHHVRDARVAIHQVALGKNEGVANPNERADDQQQQDAAELWRAGQAKVAGNATDASQLTEVTVAADERAALFRLRGIARQLQQLAAIADTADSTEALRMLLAVTKPVDQTRVTFEQALAKAAGDYKNAGGSDAARRAWLTQRREAVVKASQALVDIAKEHDLPRVFSHAQKEIKDAQALKIISQLVVMFALGLLTGFAAAAVGGLVRGAVLARTAAGMYAVGEAVEVVGGGGYMLAQLAGGFVTLSSDAVLTSLEQSGLTGESLRDSLKQNLLGSAVMALAMKPFAFIAKDLKDAGAGLVARGSVLTMDVIAASAANFAAMKLQTVGAASEPDLFDWLTQGGMMAVGKAVGTRLAAMHERLATLSEAAGMRTLASLQELANQIGQGKRLEALPELIAGERKALALEAEAIAHARASGTISADAAATLEAGNQAASAEIAPERIATTLWTARGLEPMSGDGSHWYGSREQVRSALADAGPGAKVISETATTVTVRINGKDVVFTMGVGRHRGLPDAKVATKRPAVAREPVVSPDQPHVPPESGGISAIDDRGKQSKEYVPDKVSASASAAEPEPPAVSDSFGGEATALQLYWPPNRGFMHGPTPKTLTVGMEIDRFGLEGGTFVAPRGTPFAMRGLPPESAATPYNSYKVLKPIEARSGPASPAFGQIGTGIQYELPSSVRDLIKSGHLERIK